MAGGVYPMKSAAAFADGTPARMTLVPDISWLAAPKVDSGSAAIPSSRRGLLAFRPAIWNTAELPGLAPVTTKALPDVCAALSLVTVVHSIAVAGAVTARILGSR